MMHILLGNISSTVETAPPMTSLNILAVMGKPFLPSNSAKS